MQPKFVFITGGVVSSLGKGLTAASIGKLMECKGLKISMLKLDPYLNVDPGTMSPFQHGEVYVTDDGAETDLDLGHYYRFTNSPLTKLSNTTSGQIYDTVIKRERRGDYLGNTVQVIPHITNEIKKRIIDCGKRNPDTDLVIIEIGGTVGDIEAMPFLEAIRQFRNEHHSECANIHLTYVPYIKSAGETKTKPTQHSVQVLRSIGIFPDFIVCRCEKALEQDVKDKISLFCNVTKNSVIEAPDVKNTIYELPLTLHDQELDDMLSSHLNIPHKETDLSEWKKLIDSVKNLKDTITVGIIGKYVQHQDAYKSVFEALEHGAIASGYNIEIKSFDAHKVENIEDIAGCDGYLVPGGFDTRGWCGKITAAKYCRESMTPFFGICLGLQAMVIEFARNVAMLNDANSTEMDATTKVPIISLLSEQKSVQNLGGTMRLGTYPCSLKKESKAFAAYGTDTISERHRHRYEFNNEYKKKLEDAGLLLSGKLKDGDLCEIAEIKNHPWMVSVQFHPEFKSKPDIPHPLFRDFVKAMVEHKKKKES